MCAPSSRDRAFTRQYSRSIARCAACSTRWRPAASSAVYDLTSLYPALGPSLLVCATETRTARDIERYAAALADVLQNAAAA